MPRWIEVKVGDKTAHVQVITEHPTDEAIREQAYLHETIKTQVGRMEETPGGDDPEKFLKRCRAIAKLNVERDKIRREIIRKQLEAKHKGEEIEAFFGECDVNNALALELLYAAWGISIPSEPKPEDTSAPAKPSAENS